MPHRKHPLAACEGCDLRTRPAVLTENPGASLAVVSRSPGANDVAAGRPFGGPAGQVLDYLLSEHDIDRSDVMTTNLVLCRTDKPSKLAIECCRKRLESELKDAKTIICGGAEATKELIGTTLTKARGIRHEINDKRYIATFNPAAALRKEEFFPGLRQDFKRACREPRTWRAPEVEHTENIGQARLWLSKLLNEPLLAIDIETRGLHHTAELVSIGFADTDHHAYVLGHEVCQHRFGLSSLKWFFDNYAGEQLWHNGQFDVKNLWHKGCSRATVHQDTMLLSYALDERPGTHSLDYLLQDELEWPYYTPLVVEAAKKNGFTNNEFGFPLDENDWRAVYTYNGYDCCGSRQLYTFLKDKALRDGVFQRPYLDLLIPGSHALARISSRGILFNVELAKEITETQVKPQLAKLSLRAAEICGHPINLNSSKQCGEFLYDVCKVRDPRLNEDAVKSVDRAHREHILKTVTNPTVHEFVHVLDQFKGLDKVRSTYLEALAKKVHGDGRIYFGLYLHNTESGRLSARDPNLQNQPRTSDEDIARGDGYVNIRQLYYAGDGNVFLQADYAQAELRVAAAISNDNYLLNVYREGRDLHNEIAEFLFGEQYTKEQRVAAKGANFGALYGIKPWYFSQLFGLPIGEANRVLTRWWARFPQLAAWVKETHERVVEETEIVSPFGRKRRFHLISPTNLEDCEKAGVNAPIQGTASDFTLLACIELERILPQYNAGILIPVHDSILVECPRHNAHWVANLMREVMTSVPCKYLGWEQIPFDVDISIGENWGNLHEYS